jgi:hypothetical protein
MSGCVTTVDEWNGIELLFESDLMDLKADDEDLGDMDDDNLEEWDDMDEADMLLPGCTPERSRHRASPAWASSSVASQSRAIPRFEISSPLKKKRRSPVGGQAGPDGKPTTVQPAKGGRTPSPLVYQTSRSSTPLVLTPLHRSASAGTLRAPSPVTSKRQQGSRPGSRLGITASSLGSTVRRTPVPNKLTMRISSEGTALQAAVVASSVKRSASPFVKQGSGGVSGGVEALKNINKMVNRSAAQSRAKQRSSSRGSGSRSATPTPSSGPRPITPGPEGSAADGALVSFGVPPAEGGHCADEARPKPQRFRQFGALGGGGTLVAMPSPSLLSPTAMPAETRSSSTFPPLPPSCFFAPAGAPARAAASPSPSPRPSLGAGGSGSGGDAAPAAEAASCGSTAGGTNGSGSGRIHFKVSTGALLRPTPTAPHSGTATLKPTPLLPGAASFSISGRGLTSSLPPSGLPPSGLPPSGLPPSGIPRSGGLTIKTVPTGGLTIKTVASGKGKPS